MLVRVCGPFAQAIRRSHSKELKSFSEPRIGIWNNQSTASRGFERPSATLHQGMSSSLLRLLLRYLD